MEHGHQTASQDIKKETGNVQYCFEFGWNFRGIGKLTERTIALHQRVEINLHTAEFQGFGFFVNLTPLNTFLCSIEQSFFQVFLISSPLVEEIWLLKRKDRITS